MKIIFALLWPATIQPFLLESELREEANGYEEAFHRALQNAPAVYLVCYYRVERKRWGKDGDISELSGSLHYMQYY